jgi:hypothetical protein
MFKNSDLLFFIVKTCTRDDTLLAQMNSTLFYLLRKLEWTTCLPIFKKVAN